MEEQNNIKMSSEQKVSQKKKGKKALKVTGSTFKKKNFELPRNIVDKPLKGKDDKPIETPQYNVFPKYTYSQPSGEDNSDVKPLKDTFSYLTEAFKIKKGGILSKHDVHRPHDDDCTAMWLPLEEEWGGKGATDLHKTFSSIDDVFSEKLDSKDYFFKVDSKGKETPLDHICYTPLVKKAEKPDGAKEDFIEWLRTKVKIPFKEVDGSDRGDGKKRKTIEVKLAIHQEGEDTPERKVVDTMEQLRKEVPYGSTVKLFLKIKSFWIAKTVKTAGKTKMRECGFKVTCDMIEVLEKPQGYSRDDVEWDDIMGDDSDVEADDSSSNKKQKVEQKVEKKNVQSSDSDSNSGSGSGTDSDSASAAGTDSDSDSDSPVEEKNTKKNSSNNKSTKNTKKQQQTDSDQDSDAESDHPPTPKKDTKKSGKSSGKSSSRNK
jgi:hypothetical protein